MKHKTFGIFGKVFFYTVLICAFVIGVAAIFFAGQVKSVFETTQKQQLEDVFEPLVKELQGKSDSERVKIAEKFHDKNSSFEFSIISNDGHVLYKTKNFVNILPAPGTLAPGRVLFRVNTLSNKHLQYGLHVSDDINIYMRGTMNEKGIYNKAIYKTAMALLILLVASVLGAAIFARSIAKPVKKIAVDTRRMANLELVEAPKVRGDEIGQLAGDVYKMYRKLNLTIRQLENEIKREKEMEENQRYFFSAASHELKTPIAATSALLEGMLENVIDASEYPQYLRECLKMMSEQNRLISEILEIVKLSDDRITGEIKQANLKEIVLNTLPTYQTLADAKGIKMHVDIPDDVACKLDIKLFGRVLSNVVMNAVQNTQPQEEICIFTKNKENSTIRLCVLNTNAEISKEILPKLFEPFYREDKARSRSQGHSGLGLTIVKKALDLMKIRFSLENTGAGVLFWMDLPL
jgi:two-component system sensor histidine kinase VanS